MAALLPITLDVAWADVSPAPVNKTDGATVVAKVDPLDKYRNAQTLSATELADLLSLVGFHGHSLTTAIAVVAKESHGNPLDHNFNPKTGDNSYGLFQINMYGNLEADRLKTYNLKTNADLYDPVTNAQVAFSISNSGTNFGPWKM